MDVHREIAAATRVAWDHASALLIAARLAGIRGADHDAIADYVDAARDRWHRADYRARRETDRRECMSVAVDSFNVGSGDEFDEFDFASMEWGHE